VAQLVALAKADAARRTCGSCTVLRAYVIPRSLGECLDCAEHVTRPPTDTADRIHPAAELRSAA
jgi:hypothetical protein